MPKEHLYWIDWMKVIGIYFIILGHLFPIGNEYIYVFSVPVFFIISGYLSYEEKDWKVFFVKLWKNLILPLIIFCFILHLAKIAESLLLGQFRPDSIPKHILNCLMGMQGNKDAAGGLDVCWFIYTLIICKLLQQLIGQRVLLQGLVILGCFGVALWYNSLDIHLYSAIIDTSLAYPLYSFGGGVTLNRIERLKRPVLLLGLILSVGLVFLIGFYNGGAKMYDASYGKNIILFLIGSLAGTYAIYVISVLIQNVRPSFLSIISSGTIIILGLHPLFIRVSRALLEPYKSFIVDYSVALLILCAFVPIIILSKKYFPVLLGTRTSK